MKCFRYCFRKAGLHTMVLIHIAAFVSLLLILFCFSRQFSASSPGHSSVCLLFGAALLLRLLLAFFYHGFHSDIACFAAWADRMYAVGPGRFYSPEVFTDYPPGYMYVLYPIGAICNLLGISAYSGVHLMLLKLPAIVCDLACGWLLYREADKRFKNGIPLLLAAAYLCHPVILLNSSLWGQVDSVLTLTVVLLCLCLVRGRTIPACMVFGIGILLKPQMLVFTPVLFAGLLDHLFLQGFCFRRLMRNLLAGLGILLGMVLLCLPFGLENVIMQYTGTLGSYAYAAVNAFNFWGLLGLNWVSQDTLFLGLACKLWGTLALVLITAAVMILSLRLLKLWKHQDRVKYPLLGAFAILSTFAFSVRMHERYLYPGLILLLFAYLYYPVKQLAVCYGVFSILHLYNTAYVLFFYDPSNYDRRAPLIAAVSFGMLAGIVYFYHTLYLLCRRHKPLLPEKCARPIISIASIIPDSLLSPAPPMPSGKKLRLTRSDRVLMLAITLIYSCFALYDLGDLAAPATGYPMVQAQSIELEFGGDTLPVSFSYYIAPRHDCSFRMEGAASGQDSWTGYGDIVLNTVFTWQSVPLGHSCRRLRLTLTDSQANILELVFLDEQGNILTPLNASDYAALFDEAALYPQQSTFRSSMYFDEIYHARTAYEFLHGLPAYENTHPPLGKILISVGIFLFGMNPFGWRIVGTLFGIAMVPLMYLFARKLTRSTLAAVLGCVLFSFDFMHFTQTRLATIDVYITFFVILMYYLMYQYSRMSFYDTSLQRTMLPLGACGICMGLGISCKWTGAYAGAGLALLFAGALLRRYREYRFAALHPADSSGGISHAAVLKIFPSALRKTIGFCCIFFVGIPAVIYLLSYLPFVDASHSGLVSGMLANQESMLRYHSSLESTHPYSSAWYEWPAIIRPVWYYSGIVSDTLREGISAFGNPLVWWAGIPAFLYVFYLALCKKDRTAAFLSISYLAQYLPWFFVTRITFIYHYFPSVPFVALMLAYSLMQWKPKAPRKVFPAAVLGYAAAAFALFLLFYPVLSGQPVEADFVAQYLRWFDGWVLTAR